MEIIEQAMRNAAAELFSTGRVDVMVGFENGSDGYRCKPVFIRSAAEAGKLTWDATCSQNLAVYLPGLFRKDPRAKEARAPRVGFVAKACDMRSIIALVKENQAPRENCVIVGMPCRGMIDAGKLEAAVQQVEIRAISEEGDDIHVLLASGSPVTLPREQLVQDCCRDCRFPAPVGADVTVPGASRPAGANGDHVLLEAAKLTAAERWEKFSSEISRCIRCYACRQACPTCYCTECFAETNSPAWIGVTTELSDTMIFHLTRIFHQAGRCVECDSCVRACPMGIDLRWLTKSMAADVRELFGFTPGFDPETPPPLVTFKDDDDQGFISESHRG